MANNLSDLNEHLFNQLKRLNNPELKGDDLQTEIQRASSINKVSANIIKNAKITLDAAKLVSTGTIIGSGLPDVIGMTNAKRLS